MGDIQLATQSAPATPSSGNVILFADTTTEKLHSIGDDGINRLVQVLANTNTADVTANAADTYLTGSSLAIPPSLVRVNATFNWRFAMSKTNAGTAAAVWSVRFGTAGTTGDTARVSFTNTAATNVADNGMCDITVVCRVAGASAILAGVLTLWHLNGGTDLAAATGLIGLSTVDVKQNTSAAFDATVASSIIGVSVNPGASGVWTFQLVSAYGFNL